jgi:nicotinamidase/pyrazinamidase
LQGHSSFASQHEGKSPFDEVDLAYGTQTLWPDHCVQGTYGCEFHADLSFPSRVMVVRKGYNAEVDSYSAFFENDRSSDTGLDEYLKAEKVTRVVVVGLAYDFCVKYTALDARRLGYDVFIIRNCCRGVNMPGTMESAEKELAAAGVHVVESLADVASAL